MPKVSSLNPEDMRLAILVEDHPCAFKNFKDAISKGNYGAGNVIVWDIGTYDLAENENQKDTEQQVNDNFTAGHLSFTLYCKKLHLNFSLIKRKGKQDDAWLLLKKDDLDSTICIFHCVITFSTNCGFKSITSITCGLNFVSTF